jgi:hypothetical protein
MVLPTVYPVSIASAKFDRSFSAVCYPRSYFQARLAFTMASFNVLVQWHGFQPTMSGFVPLSIAEFSL